MFRQRLVQDEKVRINKVQSASVLLQDFIKKRQRFLLHHGFQTVIKIGVIIGINSHTV